MSNSSIVSSPSEGRRPRPGSRPSAHTSLVARPPCPRSRYRPAPLPVRPILQGEHPMRSLLHNRFRSVLALAVLVLLTLGGVRPAAAQWAVIDVSAIQQLIQQYEVLEQQLTT